LRLYSISDVPKGTVHHADIGKAGLAHITIIARVAAIIDRTPCLGASATISSRARAIRTSPIRFRGA
jgi:hypothetical protein